MHAPAFMGPNSWVQSSACCRPKEGFFGASAHRLAAALKTLIGVPDA
jgi:hypothetical protein